MIIHIWSMYQRDRSAQVLSMSFHYCDTSDNPYFVECKAAHRQGCRKHPTYLMNVSRGTQRPARVPTDCARGRACGAYDYPRDHITEGTPRRGQYLK